MPRALARTALADLRRHRLQSILVFVILATATMALTLTVTVQRVTAGPFDRLMRETDGAHLWFVAEPGFNLPAATSMEGIAGATGPSPLARARLAGARGSDPAATIGIDLLAQPPEGNAVGRPLLLEGRWLGGEGEVVLDPTVASFLRLRPGDRLDLQGADGPVALEVVGLAVHMASWEAEGGSLSHRPFAYVLPGTLARIVPDAASWRSVLGVRLQDPSAASEYAAALLERIGAGDAVRVTDWRDLRAAATADSEIDVVLLSIFSLFALVAAGLVIANAIAGRVLAQYREIGLLKAVGFTPGGVLALFLLEHLALGLLAAVLGLGSGAVLAPLFEDDLSSLLATTPVSPYAALPLLGVVGMVEGTVALATLLPALRGARIPTVQAVTAGVASGRPTSSRLARTAARLGLPVTVVLGLKDVFARPLRAWVTVAALALTVVTLTFSLGMEATVRDLLHRPERWGMPFDLLVRPTGVPGAEVERLLAEQPEVRGVVARRPLDARVEGESATIAGYAISGDLGLYGAAIPEGRLLAAPGEAIAGQALLDQLGLRVGDDLRLRVEGKPVDVRIVGRYVETDHDGRVVLFGLDTYRMQVDPAADPTEFAVRLEPGAVVPAVMDALARGAGGRVQSSPMSIGAEDDALKVRSILVGLNLVLVLIGGVNLLSTTMLGVRERFRDAGILKAIGVTPAQVVRSVLAGVAALALLAVLVGIPLGLAVTQILFNELGRRLGVGPGVGTMPSWPALMVLLPAAVLLALLGGILPARRAASLPVADALRYE